MSDAENGFIHRVALDGTGMEPFVTPAYSHGLAASTRELHYQDVPTGLIATPVDGGAEVRIAETRGIPSSMAADDEALSWVESNYQPDAHAWQLRGLVR